MTVLDRRIRSTPPKPTARKASPVNTQFEDKAKEVLRAAIAEKGVTVEELTKRLATIGVEMSAGGVANKISRGGFSAAFFLQCAEALDIDVRLVSR